MRFGICINAEASAVVKASGWDFVEENIQSSLQGTIDDAQWSAIGGAARVRRSALPLIAANSMLPAGLKVTGPEFDLPELREYVSRVLRRAGETGMTTLVFGSGGARDVPDGFDRTKARDEILEFLQTAAPLAQQSGVTIVVEPLNRQECNIINTLAEAMEYVRDLDHSNIRCLVDSFHFWTEDEPLRNIEAATPWITHVHVADKDGRVAPGESGTSDYRGLFGVLKRAGYAGAISVEAPGFDEDAVAAKGRNVLEFLRNSWEGAA